MSFLTVSCGAARNGTVLRHEDNYWLSFKVIHQKMASVPLSKNTFHVKPAEAERLRSTFKSVLSKNEASALSIPTVKNLFSQLNQERSTNLKLIFDHSLESPLYLRFSRQLRPSSLKKSRPKRRFILIIETFSTDKRLPTWTLNMLESLVLEGIPPAFFAGLIGVAAASTFCLSTIYSIGRKQSVSFRNLYKKRHIKYPDIISQIGKQMAFYEQIDERNCLIRDLVEKSRLIPASPISWLTHTNVTPFAQNIEFACLGAPFTETILELQRPPVLETIPQKLVLVAPADAISDEYLAALLRLKNKTMKEITLILLDMKEEHFGDIVHSNALEQLKSLKGPTERIEWRFAQINRTTIWTISSRSPNETKKFILDAEDKKTFNIAQAITHEYQELTSEKLTQLVNDSLPLDERINILVFDETSQALSITKPESPVSIGLFFSKDPTTFDLRKDLEQINFDGKSFQTTHDFIMLNVKSENPLEIFIKEDQGFITKFYQAIIAIAPQIAQQMTTHEERMKKREERQQSLAARAIQSRVFATFFNIEKQKNSSAPISFEDFSARVRSKSNSIDVLLGFTAKFIRDGNEKELMSRKYEIYKHDLFYHNDNKSNDRVCSDLRETLQTINKYHKPGDDPIIIFDLSLSPVYLTYEVLINKESLNCPNIQNAQLIFFGNALKCFKSQPSPHNDFDQKDLSAEKPLTKLSDYDSYSFCNGLHMNPEDIFLENPEPTVVVSQACGRLFEKIRPAQICIDFLLEERPHLRRLIEENPNKKMYYLKIRYNGASARPTTRPSVKAIPSASCGAGCGAGSSDIPPASLKRRSIHVSPPAGSPTPSESFDEMSPAGPKNAIFKKADLMPQVGQIFNEIAGTTTENVPIIIFDLHFLGAEEFNPSIKLRIRDEKTPFDNLDNSPLIFLQHEGTVHPESLKEYHDLASNHYFSKNTFATLVISDKKIAAMPITPGERRELSSGGELETPDRINIEALLKTRENLKALIEARPGASIYYIKFIPET